jgi:hypothetical protein
MDVLACKRRKGSLSRWLRRVACLNRLHQAQRRKSA